MKNKKGYYIDFDKSGKVDAIFAIFDESEMVKVLNFCEKKFLPHALNQSKVYKFLEKTVFVNEDLFKYFRKRFLDYDVSKFAQPHIYSACFEPTGVVSNIYRQDVGKVEIINESGSWETISDQSNGYMKSTTIDYETFVFLTQDKNPENYLRNMKYKGKNITEDLFHDKTFVRCIEDMLGPGALSFPTSVKLKYTTVNEIKDLLFPKKNEDSCHPFNKGINFGSYKQKPLTYVGMDFGHSDHIDAMTWAVYNTTPAMLQGHWIEEIIPRGGLGQRLREEKGIKSFVPKTKVKFYIPSSVEISGYTEVISYTETPIDSAMNILLDWIDSGSDIVIKDRGGNETGLFRNSLLKTVSVRMFKV